MKPDRVAADLEQFLAERGVPLLRSAVLLTGSREAGEDLLQAALERLRRWRAIDGSPEPYLRQTLYHLAADGWRRQRMSRRRLGLLTRAQDRVAPDVIAEVDLRDSLVRLGAVREQTDFRWLPPTRANLARLQVTIPAGFTQGPPPGG